MLRSGPASLCVARGVRQEPTHRLERAPDVLALPRGTHALGDEDAQRVEDRTGQILGHVGRGWDGTSSRRGYGAAAPWAVSEYGNWPPPE